MLKRLIIFKPKDTSQESKISNTLRELVYPDKVWSAYPQKLTGLEAYDPDYYGLTATYCKTDTQKLDIYLCRIETSISPTISVYVTFVAKSDEIKLDEVIGTALQKIGNIVCYSPLDKNYSYNKSLFQSL